MTQTQGVKVSFNQDSTCCACCGLIVLLILGVILYRSGVLGWLTNTILSLLVIFGLVYFTYRLYRLREKQKARAAYAEYMRQNGQRRWTYEQRWQEQGQNSYGPTNNANTGLGEKDPYKILGVSEYASESEVKDAYRRLVKEWHPDTFSTKGDEVKKVATERFDEIQKAYEQIKQQKGWK